MEIFGLCLGTAKNLFFMLMFQLSTSKLSDFTFPSIKDPAAQKVSQKYFLGVINIAITMAYVSLRLSSDSFATTASRRGMGVLAYE